MPDKVTLEVSAGPLTGRVFTFEEHETFIFGREEDCHARLPEEDNTVSRQHFLLEVNPPDARLQDLGSLNGTWVNGKKYGGRPGQSAPDEAERRRSPAVDLKDGDEIVVGKTAFRLRVATEPVGRDSEYAPAKCHRCGRDVSADVTLVGAGDYTCMGCRETFRSDPAELLRVLTASPGPPAEGRDDLIAGYEIVRKLGEGGMGVVYLARRREGGELTAVKMLLSKVAVDERSRRLFEREVEVTSSLRHPNIVEPGDYWSAENVFCFTMEYCAGGSVWDLMTSQGGKLTLGQAGPIILQTLEGLSHAHERNFVHRDIKPPNILLTAREGGVAKLADFGLAKNFQKAGFSGLTATGAFAGTFFFMPREQLINFKRSKPVSDVWSLGATFYAMLTGRPPRDFPKGRSPAEVVMADDVTPVRRRDADIPSAVAEVIDRSLAQNVEDRYQTAAEFREALVRVL